MSNQIIRKLTPSVSWADSAPLVETKRTALSSSSDTLSKARKEEEKISLALSRVELPRGSSQDPNYLSNLASAFCKIYESMGQSTQQTASELASLQTFDQAMAAASMKSISDSITASQANFVKYQAEEKIENEEAKDQRIVSIFSYVVGGVLLAFTAASALLDGGASLLAAPEEFTELTDLGGQALSSLTDESGEGVPLQEMNSSQVTPENDYDPDDPDEAAKNQMDQMEKMMDRENMPQVSQEEQTEELSQRDTFKARQQELRNNTDLAKARKFFSNRLTKFFVGIGGSISFTLPDMVQSSYNIIKSRYLQEIATTQTAMGQANGEMQRTSYVFQFFQQLVQRTASVAEQQVSQLSDVIETASGIFSAYRQIPYGLAQAV